MLLRYNCTNLQELTQRITMLSVSLFTSCTKSSSLYFFEVFVFGPISLFWSIENNFLHYVKKKVYGLHIMALLPLIYV